MLEGSSDPEITPQMKILQLDSDSPPVERVVERRSKGKPRIKDGSRAVAPSRSRPGIPCPKDCFVLPYPPPDFNAAPRFYFFGWPITDDGLAELAEKGRHPPSTGQHTCHDGLRYLARQSGYPYIYPVDGLVENGETYEEMLPSESNSKDVIFRAVMVHVNHKKFYHRRPNKVEMKTLEQIFGTPGRWFKDGHSMKRFSKYYMDMWSPGPD